MEIPFNEGVDRSSQRNLTKLGIFLTPPPNLKPIVPIFPDTESKKYNFHPNQRIRIQWLIPQDYTVNNFKKWVNQLINNKLNKPLFKQNFLTNLLQD